MYTINFPAIAPSAAHNFSVKTIEFKMAAVSVKRSITNHLNTCHLSRETLTESQLILARAGIFDFPVSKFSETMICPKHRHTLGKYWKQRRPCQYPTHKGGKKAVKTRDVVNVAMAKEILKLHEVVVPIGSGLLSTFSHFYIITLSRRIK